MTMSLEDEENLIELVKEIEKADSPEKLIKLMTPSGKYKSMKNDARIASRILENIASLDEICGVVGAKKRKEKESIRRYFKKEELFKEKVRDALPRFGKVRKKIDGRPPTFYKVDYKTQLEAMRIIYTRFPHTVTKKSTSFTNSLSKKIDKDRFENNKEHIFNLLKCIRNFLENKKKDKRITKKAYKRVLRNLEIHEEFYNELFKDYDLFIETCKKLTEEQTKKNLESLFIPQ